MLDRRQEISEQAAPPCLGIVHTLTFRASERRRPRELSDVATASRFGPSFSTNWGFSELSERSSSARRFRVTEGKSNIVSTNRSGGLAEGAHCWAF